MLEQWDSRQAVVDYLKRRRGLDYSVDNIVATVGGSEALSSSLGHFSAQKHNLLFPFRLLEPIKLRLCLLVEVLIL